LFVELLFVCLLIDDKKWLIFAIPESKKRGEGSIVGDPINGVLAGLMRIGGGPPRATFLFIIDKWIIIIKKYSIVLMLLLLLLLLLSMSMIRIW
jgi:hypothetical protein